MAPATHVAEPHVGADGSSAEPRTIWIPSPNFGVGSDAIRHVRWIVVHTTEDPVDKVIARLTDPATRVSVHYLVTRDRRIIQFVKDRDVAYGTGNLAYNRASISIEFERYGSLAVTESQFHTAKPLIASLVKTYGIQRRCLASPRAVAPVDPLSDSGIIGHGNVPDPKNPTAGGGANHHTDPLNWDWRAFETIVFDR
jgi:N-acetyl-anhydromuramyl-L-alanine amidase AmpD